VTPVLIAVFLSGCVLDRTGQSASEVFRRDLILQATRLNNLENQFDQVESRVSQLEELNRARGQDEILRMESLEEIRSEVARLRGEIEVMTHNYGGSLTDLGALQEDATFRLTWLEDRAAQLEENLGLTPPPPPEPSEDDAGDARSRTPEPSADEEPAEQLSAEDLLSRAQAHLDEDRDQLAEAVLERFLSLYPDHPELPHALYMRARASFKASNYSASVLHFQEVIDGHKTSDWASWSMLGQGECFDAQEQPENARLFYEDVIRIWPGSDAAREARKKLRR
jgi:TolA-binding protein